MTIDVQKLAVALGRSAPEEGSPERAQWEQWIQDALIILRAGDEDHAGIPNLDALDQDVLDYVVREAVVAHIRRPGDATQVEVAVDDGRTIRRYTSGKGRVAILDEWWAMLTPAEHRSSAYTIRPHFTPDVEECGRW